MSIATRTDTKQTDNQKDPLAQYRDILNKQKILLVDDEKGIRKSLGIFLSRNGFMVDEAENGEEAQEMLEKHNYFLVFTDITMPRMDGIDLTTYIIELKREIDVIIITGHRNIDFAIKAIKMGAFDYMTKPFMLDEVQSTIRKVLEKQTLKKKSIELELLKVRRKTEEKYLTEFMIMLAKLIDAKSPFTRQHSERVSEYSVQIARHIGLDEEEITQIALGARLHDIGKMGTPDYILNKDGPLTDDEYDTIKEHPKKGAELIQPLSSLEKARDIIHYHHENLDGSGYPDGLVGEEVPLHARIVKIADYWDAITSTRPYRQPMSREKAASILLKEAETNRVDPILVDALLCQVNMTHGLKA